jgi:hypothetical protein
MFSARILTNLSSYEVSVASAWWWLFLLLRDLFQTLTKRELVIRFKKQKRETWFSWKSYMVKNGTHGLVKSFLIKWSSAIYPVGREDIYVGYIYTLQSTWNLVGQCGH